MLRDYFVHDVGLYDVSVAIDAGGAQEKTRVYLGNYKGFVEDMDGGEAEKLLGKTTTRKVIRILFPFKTPVKYTQVVDWQGEYYEIKQITKAAFSKTGNSHVIVIAEKLGGE